VIPAIADITQLKKSRPPAVFWRDKAKQFMTYIGFHRAQKSKNKGHPLPLISPAKALIPKGQWMTA
jgi:hypothetical protein